MSDGHRAHDAEQAVLCAVLCAPDALPEIAAILSADDFADPRHALIFTAMQAVAGRGRDVDPLTVADELIERGALERAGGKDYLAQLIDAVPTTAHVASHAALVRDAAQRRALATFLDDGARGAREGKLPPADLAANVRTALEAFTACSDAANVVHSLEELLTDPSLTARPEAVGPPMAWVGRVSLAAGREKRGGKSTAACGVVAQASRQGRRALVISLDEHLGDTVQRLARFGADPHRVFLMDQRPADLGAVIRSTGAEIVVIDALSVWANKKEKPESGDSAAWEAVMRPIVDAARKTGAGVIIIHHASKGSGEYRDSSAIGSNVDVIITLEEQAGGARRAKVEGRIPAPAFTVTLDAQGIPQFTVQDAATPAGTAADTAPLVLQRRVLTLLRSAEPDGLRTTDWARLAKENGISRTSFYDARQALYTSGRLTFQSRVYRLSEDGAHWLASKAA